MKSFLLESWYWPTREKWILQGMGVKSFRIDKKVEQTFFRICFFFFSIQISWKSFTMKIDPESKQNFISNNPITLAIKSTPEFKSQIETINFHFITNSKQSWYKLRQAIKSSAINLPNLICCCLAHCSSTSKSLIIKLISSRRINN